MQITVQSGRQNLGIEAAPYLHARLSTNMMMALVLASLLPFFAAIGYFFGLSFIWQFLISVTTAAILTVIVALLRRRSIKRSVCDLSYVVTAAILALTIPPLLPWYLTVSATIFAILIVREFFGGLGMNIFNPAMAGFIFLAISSPGVFYETWIAPAPQAYKAATLSCSARVIFEGANPKELTMAITELRDGAGEDALTGATFLESLKTARKAGNADAIPPVDFTSDEYMAYAFLAGAAILGGIFLIGFKIIHYEMPAAFLLTVAGTGALWHYLDPGSSLGFMEHLLFGGTMLTAFFIITDPVTNAGTLKGRVIFAILTGLLLIAIRVKGSYSDSAAFAVMLANAAAPLIDVLTRRRPFGVGYRKGGLD